MERLFPAARLREPLSRYTAWKIGGPADALLEPKSSEELCRAIQTAHENGVPVTVLGGGTNVLVSDGGVRGLVLRLAKSLKEVEFGEDPEGPYLTADAGALYPVLANTSASRGLGGMEFATGIPGTVGGAVFMNAGAYGSETKETLLWAEVFRGGEVARLTPEDLRLGYRRSLLQDHPDWTVLRARHRLRPDDPNELKRRIREYRAQRMSGSPSRPSCGSTFKRPPGDFPGRVIEEAGLKGTTVGNLQVSPVHANYLVNLGGATAEDALKLTNLVRRTVKEKLGVDLETEVRFIGEGM